uniref:Protein FAM136A n=1 Tax=Oryctolagus cuniculus TaxID=9986 RepID=A0A5F9DV15_RABIT
MAELQQLRLQEAVDSMVKNLERESIRRCRASRSSAALAVVRTAGCPCSRYTMHRHCHMPLAQAQALVTSELEKLQDRLARSQLPSHGSQDKLAATVSPCKERGF